MKMTALYLCAPVGLASAVACAAGGLLPIQSVVLEGDSVPGVGLVTSIAGLDVNNVGQWSVEVDTDFADTDFDGAMLREFGLLLREGDPVGAPAGATLDSFDSYSLNNNGDQSFNHFLDGTTGSSDDSGVYRNGELLIQESNLAPSPPFGNPTPYIGFFDTKINDNDQIFIVASVDDPNVSSTVDRALVRLDYNGPGSFTETRVAGEGDVAGETAGFITDFGTGPHQSAVNNNGDWLYTADTDLPTSEDTMVFLNNDILAQEGFASGVPGRLWGSLSSAEVDINNAGDYVISATVDGDTSTNAVIVKNGSDIIAQEGQGDAPGGFNFTSFGSGPVLLDDSGNVFYYGDWDDPNTDIDTGLFMNDMLLVQEGVSMVDGVLVDTLRGITEGYAVSDNGAYLIFEAVLEDGTDGAFLVFIPAPASLMMLGMGLVCTRRRR